jgi:2-amino-4-hydroxy-6-hydroxymethyldihydropteridine diphosphokinase
MAIGIPHIFLTPGGKIIHKGSVLTLVYLALGSNLGEREAHLREARRRLEDHGARLLRTSRVVESEPLGVVDQPRFLNQVLEAEWDRSPRELLVAAKQVEEEVGRTPSARWGPREIDVDILLFGNEHLVEPDLVIPHPGLLERPFVREPLRELRPDILEEP